jgi:hypothetical protein
MAQRTALQCPAILTAGEDPCQPVSNEYFLNPRLINSFITRENCIGTFCCSSLVILARSIHFISLCVALTSKINVVDSRLLFDMMRQMVLIPI